jgi:hypothetical protein
MLLQTNSYIVPKEKRSEHTRLMRRFRHALGQLGCDMFEVYEQAGANWNGADTTGRYVQIMRFRDRKHQIAVQNAEKTDPQAQALIAEFCELVNFQYQQQQGFFAVGFYHSVVSNSAAPVAPAEAPIGESMPAAPMADVHEPMADAHAQEAIEPVSDMVEGHITEVVLDAPLEAGEPAEEAPPVMDEPAEGPAVEEQPRETGLPSRRPVFEDVEELEEVEAEPLELGGEGAEHHDEASHEDNGLLSEEELLGELLPDGPSGEGAHDLSSHAEFDEDLIAEEITGASDELGSEKHAAPSPQPVEEIEATPERRSFFKRRPR